MILPTPWGGSVGAGGAGEGALVLLLLLPCCVVLVARASDAFLRGRT